MDTEKGSIFRRKSVLIPGLCLLAGLIVTAFFTRKMGLRPSANQADSQVAGLPLVSGADLSKRFAKSPAKLILLNFWASWCGPCRKELPTLKALNANMAARGLSVVLLSVDREDDMPDADEIAHQLGLIDQGGPAVLAKSPSDDEFFADLGLQPPTGIPATFLIQPGGKVVAGWLGIKSFEEMKLELAPYLE